MPTEDQVNAEIVKKNDSEPKGSREGSRVYTLTEPELMGLLWLAVAEYSRIVREVGGLWASETIAERAVNYALRRAHE